MHVSSIPKGIVRNQFNARFNVVQTHSNCRYLILFVCHSFQFYVFKWVRENRIILKLNLKQVRSEKCLQIGTNITIISIVSHEMIELFKWENFE